MQAKQASNTPKVLGTLYYHEELVQTKHERSFKPLLGRFELDLSYAVKPVWALVESEATELIVSFKEGDYSDLDNPKTPYEWNS